MFLFIICMKNMQILNLEGLKIDSLSETTKNFASNGFLSFSRLFSFVGGIELQRNLNVWLEMPILRV